MSDLNPNEVAAWFRQQAKTCIDQANQFEEMARQAERVNMVLHWASAPGPVPATQPQPKILSADIFENRIRRKNARVYQIAQRFGVTQSEVKALLEPVTKVYEAERGWLKIR